MLIDGIELTEGSEAKNLTVARGTAYPTTPNEGELFYNDSIPALCVFKSGDWVEIGAVRTVAGQAGDVELAVEDVERALSSDLLNVPNGIPTLNALGHVPDEQLNTYNKDQIDTMVATASSNQYHNTPYDIASAIVSKPSGSAKVLRFVAARSFSIPANMVGSIFRAGVPSKGTAIFGVYKNDTQIGTLTFTAGAALATMSTEAASFSLGDVLGITAPPVQDEKLADITLTIAAKL